MDENDFPEEYAPLECGLNRHTAAGHRDGWGLTAAWAESDARSNAFQRAHEEADDWLRRSECPDGCEEDVTQRRKHVTNSSITQKAQKQPIGCLLFFIPVWKASAECPWDAFKVCAKQG